MSDTLPKRVTISHPRRPEISVTVGPATRAQMAAATITQGGSNSTKAGRMNAAFNMLHDDTIRIAPSKAEALAALNKWPALAHEVWTQIYLLSGGLRIATFAEVALPPAERRAVLAQADAWRLDLVQLWKAAQEIRDLEATPADAKRDESLRAMRDTFDEDLLIVQESGLSEQLEVLARRQAGGEVRALYTKCFGVFLIHPPDFMASVEWENRTRESAFDAIEQLAMKCVEHPDTRTLTELLLRLPGLTSSLAFEARDMAEDGLEAVIKKE